MSLQQIYDDLDAALHNGAIKLTANTVPGLAALFEALGLVAGGDAGTTLPMAGAQLRMGPSSVLLTGTATYRNFTWSATLTGESPDGGNRFSLSMQGQDRDTPWTFGTSFPNLPQTRRLSESGTLVLYPSIITPLVVRQPIITATGGAGVAAQKPRLQGWVVLTGTRLEPYVGYLNAQELRADGEVDFGNPAQPVLMLWAAAPGADLSIPPMIISEVGLLLQSDYFDIYSLEDDGRISVAALYAKIQIGTTSPIYATVTAPLLQGDTVWPLNIGFRDLQTVGNVMRLVLDFFDQDDPGLFAFPLAQSLLDSFGLKSVELGVQPPLFGRTLELKYAGLQFEATDLALSWNPIPFITIDQLGTGWIVHWYSEGLFVTGNIWGRLVFFDNDDFVAANGGLKAEQPLPRVELLLTATIPDFDITGSTQEPIEVPLWAILKKYLGGDTGDMPHTLTVCRIMVQASPRRQTYQGTLLVESNWPLEVGKVTFNLDRIMADIMVSQSKVTGIVSGFASIKVSDEDPEEAGSEAVFLVQAEYRGSGVWRFEGGLAQGTLKLTQFAFGLTGSEPPDAVPDIELVKLWLSYETSEGNPYSASGALLVRWTPELLGRTLSLLAEASVARRPQASPSDRALLLAAPHRAADDMVLEGSVSGTFKVNQLAITAGLSFVDSETVYLFEVAFGKFSVRAVTQWVDDKTAEEGAAEGAAGSVADDAPTGRHQVLAVSMGRLTLGEVVEYLVNLANPNLNYQLDSPWDVLNSIDLSRFTLLIDPTEQTITLTYDVALELGFMSVTTVGIRYDRSGGEGKVKFVLTGRFLTETYDSNKPLTWDAANEPPPQVPGEGTELIDLHYLGLGQHFTLSGLTNYDSVSEVLAELVREMQPVDNLNGSPLANSQLRFDESSQWMFGLDCTVIETVRLGLVLHDPDLYGLVVSLSGSKAGSMAGLSFELLYKKVTDDVGVFRVRLQVPDAFRQLDFGYVAVTLGIITVDIFTNGNFLVDLGFPHGGNFSTSFGLQVGPFMGRGGIYFGLLNGATSRRVPAITNGNFSPVLELGIGLSVGVGRTFNKGPLRAELYVQMVAIFEGVLGWFNPNDKSQPSALYYWGQASAGLVGKLYGSIDFKVIRASVSIEAHAIVSISFAAYRETVVMLDVGVSVHAEVSILFVTTKFDFDMQLTATFTMGQNSQAPWKLAEGQSQRSATRMLGNLAPARRRNAWEVRLLTRSAFVLARKGHESLRRLTLAGGRATAYDLNWRTDITVFPDAVAHAVTVKMVPAYTMDQVPVKWTAEQPTPAGSTAYRIAFLLMADNGVPPNAKTIAEARVLTADTSATASTALDTSFNVLIEGMLRWAISALGLDPVAGNITAGKLQELADQIDLPETASTGFAMSTLGSFFKKNLEFRISGIPSGTPTPIGGTAFPIPPPLGWDSVDAPPDPLQRRFSLYPQVDSTYEQEVAAYFAMLDPRPGDAPTVSQEGGADDVTESMATFVFRDYFLMLTKTAVQGALDVLASFPYEVTAGESLLNIAQKFPTIDVAYVKNEGDTVEQVAYFYGLAVTELLALNPYLKSALDAATPGAEVPVVLGVTPESIAAGNPIWPLTAGLPVPLGDIVYQLADGDTLEQVATSLGADVDAWLKTEALLDQPGLLSEGAQLNVPESSFVNSGGLALSLVAALFFVRLDGVEGITITGDEDVPLVDWYVAAISQLNGDKIANDTLPSTLLVPRAFDDLTDPLSWTTLPGDTIWYVAAYFALAQYSLEETAFAAYLAQVQALNQGAGPFARVKLPAAPTAVLADENLADLAERLPIELPDPDHSGQYFDQQTSFRRLVRDAQVLTPLFPLVVPNCTVSTKTGQTLGTFAQLYNLALEEVGRRLAKVEGLLATWPTHLLAVPHPPTIEIDKLVPAVLQFQGSTISGQVSRFLLAGMRMPAPEKGIDGRYHATGSMTGLIELVGQQVEGPAPSSTHPAGDSEERLRITVKVFDKDATWVKLYDSYVLENDEIVPGPLMSLNPGLALRHGPLRGIIALTSEVEDLVFSITETDLEVNYPASVLEPIFISNPSALALYKDVPVRHGLQQRLLWQTTEAVSLPNPGDATVPQTGMPTLWPFSDNLMRTEAIITGKDFGLFRVDTQLGPSADPVELSRYAWATLIEFGLRRIPGRANTYEVLGADTAGRQLLLEAWQYIAGSNPHDDAVLHLLYQPAPSTGLPNGLVSVALSQDRTYLVKTNLSTETHSGDTALAAADGPPTWGEYYARLADAQRFLTLLWECSVVGGGGYWLEYTTSTGSPLPQSIFSADGSARLSLLILMASQSNSESPSRGLHSFNNCVVVGESIDASAADLFAQVADSSETSRQASVTPGNVAFGAQLQKPPQNTTPIDKQIALRQLYSLLSYKLRANSVFSASRESMATDPRVPPKSLLTNGPQADEETWSLFQVVPVHRFATHPLPAVTGLPVPLDDPYAGINDGGTSNDPAMPTADIELRFREVLGNASSGDEDSQGGPDIVHINYGYTDPVVGVGAWPSTTSYFQITTPPTVEKGALLSAVISLQAANYTPGTHQRASASSATSSEHLRLFTHVYYQLMQPDVAVSLLTSLEQSGGEPIRLKASREALRAFSQASSAWLWSTSQLENVFADPVVCTTLDRVSAHYGVGIDSLARANLDVPLSNIFVRPPDKPTDKTDLTIPVYRIFADRNTVAGTCPPDTNPVKILGDAENIVLPLRPGVELFVPNWTLTVPSDPPPPQKSLSLAQLAAMAGITPASLAAANASTEGLLRPGFVFTCNDIEIEVSEQHEAVSLDDVATTLNTEGVPYNAVMVAGANADLPGMFRPGASLVVNRYLTREGDTLQSNQSGVDTTWLVQNNTGVVNLFGAGTSLYVGYESAVATFEKSLGESAQTYGLLPEQLLYHNRNVGLAALPEPLPDDRYLVVPGQAALPKVPAQLRVPYRIPAHAELGDVAALFLNAGDPQGSAALALAQANLNLPGVIAGGNTIDVNGQQVPTMQGDSFADVMSRFNPAVPLSDVVSFLVNKPDYLASGALLLTPPAQLPASASGALKPADVAALYRVAVSDLALANAGLAGLVAANVELSLRGPDGKEVMITTGPADSFNSLVQRFADEGVHTSVTEVLTANEAKEMLIARAMMLLAPPPTTLTALIGAGDLGWSFPGAIFPLQAWVEVARNASLVDEAFRGTANEPGPAVLNRTPLPPVPKGFVQADKLTLALRQFALDLQAAIPSIRVATGKVLSAEREQDAVDVWATVFGEGFIKKVEVAPGVSVHGKTDKSPQFFSLRPLQNSLVARRGVNIRPLNQDGTLGDAVPTDFQGIDMESWAGQFLEDVDLFLSAAYAAPAYQTPKRESLEKVLAAKQALAEGISLGLDYVLDLGQPDPAIQATPPPDWESARQQLRQRLLVGLAEGYGTGVIVQYEARVTSPWSAEWARLSGPGRLPAEPSGLQSRTRISNAKVSLANTPATTQPGSDLPGACSYVNFLVDASHSGDQRAVDLDLSYVVNEIEFNVQSVVAGYESSDWLTFLLPFSQDPPPGVSFQLGTPQAPLPLRAYPPLPALLSQAAEAANPQPSGYEQALHWNYAFTFQHQSMDPDQMRIEVNFNQMSMFAASPRDDDDLFASLAQYIAVAPQLWEVLKDLPHLDGSQGTTLLQNAIETLASLVDSIASRWGEHWNPGSSAVAMPTAENVAGPAPEMYRFSALLNADWSTEDSKWYYKELILTRDHADGNLDWPYMGFFLPGEAVQSMGQGEDSPTGRRYTFPPPGVEAFKLLGYEMCFVGLHIANYQNAGSKVQVVRNAQLLTSGPPTRQAFVYETPTLAFADVVTPLLTWTDDFPIGTWTDVASTNPLVAVFQNMFAGYATDRRLNCVIRYGFELAGSSEVPIVTYLPVGYRPQFEYQADVVQQIIDAVTSWNNSVKPSAVGGQWVFSFSLFSSVDGNLGRPLLELLQLYSEMAPSDDAVPDG